jgi:hypothetical protein
MSMDIEGHELNALKGIDFNKVRINVLTIENATHSPITSSPIFQKYFLI